ncbi:MAG: NACHT domain-containing protein, partial [Glutamicibacter sp.]
MKKATLAITLPGSSHRGSAGGAASTGGASYAASVAAWAAVKMLLGEGATFGWNLGAAAAISSLASEHPSQVDDLVLRFAPAGTVYLQMKHGLRDGTEFAKAMTQMVRQYRQIDFDPAHDRLVIMTDYSASGTVRLAIPDILRRIRSLSANDLLAACTVNKVTSNAFQMLRRTIEDSWSPADGIKPNEAQLREFLNCLFLSVLDPTSGSDRLHCLEMLGRVTPEAQRQNAWDALNKLTLDSAMWRTHISRPSLWRWLSDRKLASHPRTLGQLDKMFSIPELVASMNRDTIEQQVARGEFDDKLFVDRLELVDALERFKSSSARIMVVQGQSGYGKSSWCSAVANNAQAGSALLIRGEELCVGDSSLCATISRLIQERAIAFAHQSWPLQELVEWLRQEPLLLIVDGLDRTPTALQHDLRIWLGKTFDELRYCTMRIIFTTRPELLPGLRSILQDQELVRIEQLGLFSQEEAELAANRRNRPWLAQYRHPRMMSFCADLDLKDAGSQLLRHEVLTHFLKHLMGEIHIESMLLEDATQRFVNSLGRELERSTDGLLEDEGIQRLLNTDREAFQAFRRKNILMPMGLSSMRVSPDELSEYLQGMHTGIDRAFDALCANSARPLKLGALRAAIAGLGARDRLGATEWLRKLIDLLEKLYAEKDVALSELPLKDCADHALLLPMWLNSLSSLVCTVFEDIPESEGLFNDALRVIQGVRLSNFFSFVGAGSQMLRLATDPRWTTQQHLKLLWGMAIREDAYDWRRKHWLDGTPGSIETPWRRVILQVIATAPFEGFSFLLPYLNSTERLLGSENNEANLGDLAQGLFILSSNGHIDTGLDVLLDSSSPRLEQMLDHLGKLHPIAVAERISTESLAGGCLLPQVVLPLLHTLVQRDETRAISSRTARALLGRISDTALQRDCLRVLAQGGDFESAERLLAAEHDTPNANDAAAIAALNDEEFARLMPLFLTRMGNCSDVQQARAAFFGLVWHNVSQERDAAFREMVVEWASHDVNRWELAADAVEAFTHRACWSNSYQLQWLETARTIVAADLHTASDALVYGCNGHTCDDDLPPSGRDFRRDML